MSGPDIVFTLPPEGKLGLFYDTDNALGGTLHKHGLADLVEEQFVKHRDAFRAAGWYERANQMRFVELSIASLTPPVIAELNACLSISGRIGKITERLDTLH